MDSKKCLQNATRNRSESLMYSGESRFFIRGVKMFAKCDAWGAREHVQQGMRAGIVKCRNKDVCKMRRVTSLKALPSKGKNRIYVGGVKCLQKRTLWLISF